MKNLLIVLLSLVVGFCFGVGVARPSLKQLRVELATKDGELAKRKAEEDLALKELKLCMATLHTQNDQLRQNNLMMGDLIRRKRKE
jgi:Tfp pilus assembly protein PilX